VPGVMTNTLSSSRFGTDRGGVLAPLLVLAAMAAGAWLAWPYLPPALKMPYHAARLAVMEAPTALPMPVQGVGARQVADTWGAPRGSNRRHEGVDIFAPRGTPVLSTTEGVVTRVGTSRLGGKVVWVLGPAAHRHYYAHLDSHADIAMGDLVQPGDVLGFVGNTGNAQHTPSHLHYGGYDKDGAFNPYPLRRRAAAAPQPGS